eukprot:6739364-Prorocentrum_lima.AAC.1
MTSSLVGSEMCIRDSGLPLPETASGHSGVSLLDLPDPNAFINGTIPCKAVSYTHLTLPTICSV